MCLKSHNSCSKADTNQSQNQQNLFISCIFCIFMVKSIRLGEDQLHKELLKIQGELQAKTGETTTMDDVIEKLISLYKKKK